MRLPKQRQTSTPSEIDQAIVYVMCSYLGAIFTTDALLLKYRKQRRDGTPRVTKLRPSEDCPVTISGNCRLVLPMKLFFWYLAIHMTWKFKYDPLVWLSRKLGER